MTCTVATETPRWLVLRLVAKYFTQPLALVVPCCIVGGISVRANEEFSHRLVKERRSALKVEPVYFGEVFSNTRGGISTNDATRYLGLLNLGITLDCGSLPRSIPGKILLLAQNTHGEGLTTNYVGDTQVLSNIDAYRDIMQVSEYWWECPAVEEFVTLRIGKQEFNTEFLAIDTASHFVQSTFGLSPSTAFPTYPNQSMGAVAIVGLSDSWRLKSGIWDAFSRGSSWGFSGNDSVLLAGELEYSYSLFASHLPGVFAIGAVYESGEVFGGRPVSSVGEYIFQVEQAVYRDPRGDEGSSRGCSVFAGFYPRFSSGEVSEESIGTSVVAGLVSTGLMDSRTHDSCGLGLAWSELYRGGTNQEMAIELYYRIQLRPRASLQPDIQYIASPSGIYPDALVAGTRLQIVW